MFDGYFDGIFASRVNASEKASSLKADVETNVVSMDTSRMSLFRCDVWSSGSGVDVEVENLEGGWSMRSDRCTWWSMRHGISC